MTEMLDVFDANRRLIGVADRNVVHTLGLWHKTVHCWLVWNGRLLFQRRSRKLDNNPGKLYTTASGHVSAGEETAGAFRREIEQEIGIRTDNPKLGEPRHLYQLVWIGDFVKTDGKLFQDRVFADVYFAPYGGELSDFVFSDGEVDGIVAIGLDEFIAFAKDPRGKISALEFDGRETREVSVAKEDFTLVGDESVYVKFGKLAEQIRDAK